MCKGNYGGGRIEIIDAARGLSLILMILHHFAIDLNMFGILPDWLVYSRVIYVLHIIFAGLFIALAGVSSRFSRSNIRRGLKVSVCALIVTAATLLIQMPIWWGILHLLGFCMIMYGLVSKTADKIPPHIGTVLYFVLFLILLLLIADKTFDVKYLSVLGLRNEAFTSADYFPVFPWIMIFMFGTCFGRIVSDGKLPVWFYTASIPKLPAVGRKSLLIYMLHQPLLYGLTLLLIKLL
ncbi:MAG: DUF1624 domain-containing protein [Oscillospiraceae bacterium]|nr:DUF1624 domain-containing protein [Oscillospiraceae bacterium]